MKFRGPTFSSSLPFDRPLRKEYLIGIEVILKQGDFKLFFYFTLGTPVTLFSPFSLELNPLGPPQPTETVRLFVPIPVKNIFLCNPTPILWFADFLLSTSLPALLVGNLYRIWDQDTLF